MNTLKEAFADAAQKKVAIGHFNFSTVDGLRAIVSAAKELGLPVAVGAAEGERAFMGTMTVVGMVRALRAEFNTPIFLNADHCYSFETAKEAIDAGYDSIVYDGAKLSFEENSAIAKQVVAYAREHAPEALIEAELGYIGVGSQLREALPEELASGLQMTTPEEAVRFVTETGIDLLAPSVGNIHGMLKDMPEPRLHADTVAAVAQAVPHTPLVLHGGSGTTDADFVAAIDAGIRMVHINTELRVAYRAGMETGLRDLPHEVAPYKLLGPAAASMKDVVLRRLRLFNKLA